MFDRFKPRENKGIPFIIFSSFLGTYIVARLFIFLFPFFFLKIRGIHIHHFAYGIIILSVVGFIDLILRPKGKWLYRTAAAFGVGLALAYDEFGMWLHLTTLGVSRLGYDAIIVIALLFLNIIYFSDFWGRTGRRLLKNIFRRTDV